MSCPFFRSGIPSSRSDKFPDVCPIEMPSEHWKRARDLFEQVLDLPDAEREPFLVAACGDDPALLATLRELLATYDGASFLERPPYPVGVLAPTHAGPDLATDTNHGFGVRTDGSGLAGPATLPAAVGPYRVLGMLGAGGMGVVYRAQHMPTGRLVALKTVRVPSESLLAGIRREIHALARLRHPGIVRVVDEGVDGGVPWYAMELVEGTSLRAARPIATRLLADTVADTAEGAAAAPAAPATPPGSDTAADLGAALTIARRLCETLAYLHGEGIVHRDLKPDNVILRPSGQPVLVDFGIASVFAGREGREVLDALDPAAGTLAYMAPEQLRGEAVDARADLYALGCVLYELIAGRPPFVGTAEGLVRMHVSEAPAPPSRFAPQVPAALDTLVLRLLAKRPTERIGYADDVAAALARLGAEAMAEPDLPRPRAYLYRPAFAGRAEALAGLDRRIEELGGGRGGVVLVGGESGVGKTRFAVEVGRRAERTGALVLAGECQPPGAQAGSAGGALGALRGPLRRVADRCRERGEREADALLGPRGRLLARYESALEGLPGQASYPEPAELPPAAARLRLYEALSATLGALARACPLLVVLDDLQWADDLTLGLLAYLLRGTHLERAPVLVVGTYRSEEVSGELGALVGSGRAVQLRLGRLEEAAVTAIVGDMLALTPPEPLSRFLSLQSEGNPFFVAEYLRAAVEEGLLWRNADGRWQAAGEAYERLGLPGSLRALVERRLEGLPKSAAAAVAAAAVLGRELSSGVLGRVSGLEEVALMEAIEEGLRRQVFEEVGPGRLRFAHDKLREVAYGRLEAEHRAALHRAAAEALEGAEAGARSADLGHHWEAAGEPAKAAAHYLAGARHAKLQHALAEATLLYRAYLLLADWRTAESVGARNELGITLRIQGRTAEAIDEHRRAMEEASGLGDRRAEGYSIETLGDAYHVGGRLQEAGELYERALAIHRELGDLRREANVLLALAMVDYESGALAQARVLYQHALEIQRTIGDRRGEGITLGNLGNVFLSLGEQGECTAHFERALAIHREVGNLDHEGFALCNLGNALHEQGLLSEARSYYEQALAVVRAAGDRRFEGLTLNNLGVLAADDGRVEQAWRLYEQALAIAREADVRRHEGFVLSDLGILERRAGDLDEAERRLVDAEALFRAVGDRVYVGLCLCERGHVEVARGRSAADSLDEARRLMAELRTGPDSRLGRAVARLEDAVAAAEGGRPLHRGERLEDVPEGLRRALAEPESADG
jgi:eukaryotic-like serine/threonine-protein kinase